MPNELCAAPREPLLIQMPRPSGLAAEEHVWRLLASHLGRTVEFAYPDTAVDQYILARAGGVGPHLAMGFQGSPGLATRGRLCQMDTAGGTYDLWAAPSGIELRRDGDGWLMATDLIAPLRALLELQEECETPHRDQYGLVEGRRSTRQQFGALAYPFFESAAAAVGSLLGIERPPVFPGGRSWAVAVSCDVDELEGDHIPAVLQCLGEQGVEAPTFMVCTATSEEKTVRDPVYDFASQEIRTRLAHLRDANAEIGLHGSYVAHDRRKMLVDQKERLEDWAQRPVVGHRSHFYRFSHPRSWAWQYRAGLLYDASLGYPDLPGFRSGAASPTQFRDPEYGPVAFAVCPTGVLDQHFFWPQEWPEARLEEFLRPLVGRLASFGGVLTVDWHTYTRSPSYPGWWAGLVRLLSLARDRGAYLGGIGEVLSYCAREWLQLPA